MAVFFRGKKGVVMGADSIETTVARLDERFNGFNSILERMATDQERMAASYEELVKSNSRVAIIENELLTLKASSVKLWEKSDAAELARAARDQKHAEDELAAQRKQIAEDTKEANRWKREIAIACVPALFALAIAHFLGVHV